MKKIFLIFLCFGILFLNGCSENKIVMTAGEELMTTEQGTTYQENVPREDTIYVYVCGHVKKPGVYALDSDARICDALELAEGVTDTGCPESLNQAETMKDGQTIYVPGKNEKVPDSETADDGLLNINTADKAALMTLPGIGESKADLIVQYREEHGPFESVESLMDIPGIKEGVFNKIKDSIKVY